MLRLVFHNTDASASDVRDRFENELQASRLNALAQQFQQRSSLYAWQCHLLDHESETTRRKHLSVFSALFRSIKKAKLHCITHGACKYRRQKKESITNRKEFVENLFFCPLFSKSCAAFRERNDQTNTHGSSKKARLAQSTIKDRLLY